LETKRTSLSQKNVELLELSKKHRELTDLVVHAKDKSLKQQRRLLRKPNNEGLKSKAADQRVLVERLSETHAAQSCAAGDLRREIVAIEASIKLTEACLFKVIHEKRGYVEKSHRLAMKADILLSRDLEAIRRSEARLFSKIERMEKLVPHIGRINPLKNARVQIENFERMVLEKEGKAEKSAQPVFEGLSAADNELIERMMVKLDRAVEALDYHVSAMFSVQVASDPSVENAYERLLQQLNEARRLAERSLFEEYSLETHLNQFRSSERANNVEDLATLADALRKHKFNNISIDQQLFRADCIARRIFILKLLLSADPGILENEMFAYKGLLKAFSSYLEKGWNRELSGDTTHGIDEGIALLDRLSALESRVQMSFINLAKGKLINLPENKIADLAKKAPELAETIEREIAEQKTKLERWQNVLLDAEKSDARLVQFVASQRIDQSVEVVQSLERSGEVLGIIAVLLASHKLRTETIAQ
jgi:hypothetical protein